MSTQSITGLLDEAVSAIRRVHAQRPTIGVVLGSGLGAFGDTLEDASRIGYQDIPNMPMSRVVGHAGVLSLGRVENVPVACMQGRVWRSYARPARL